MWVEAILSREDLAALIGQMTPLKIRLGDAGQGGDFEITETSDVTLVADVGLRVACKAKLHWPVLGIHVPVTLSSVVVTLRPEIVKAPGGDTLVFTVHIEHTDVAGLPAIIDERITAKVNQELAEKRVELSWDFTKTLSHVFQLPEVLRPIEGLGLTVAWGKTKITSDALVLVVSFHSDVYRIGDERPPAREDPPVLQPPPLPAKAKAKAIGGSERRQMGFTIAVAALAMGGTIAVARALGVRRSR